MDFRWKWLLPVALLLLLSAAMVEVCRGPRSFFAGFDRDLQQRYDGLQIGMSHEAVLEALGQAWDGSETWCPERDRGIRIRFEHGQHSPSLKYRLWLNGMNGFYCIGLDRDGKVCIKGQGHS